MKQFITLTAISAFTTAVAQCPTYTVPHFEGFNQQVANTLPPCWTASNFGNNTTTFSNSAAFVAVSTGSNAFVSPPFQLYAGVVYSGSVWHKLSQPSPNWGGLAMLAVDSQSQISMIASTFPATSSYAPLTNTFTIPTSGIYYIAIAAICSSTNGAQYLHFADFSLFIPCTIAANVPSVAVAPPQASVCSNDPITFTASGASTYSWSNGMQGATATYTLNVPTTIYVVGTSTLTGCSMSANPTLTVHPTPAVAAFALPSSICKGQSAALQASGAQSYTWSNESNSASTNVQPEITSVFTVTGSAANGCKASVTIEVIVNSASVTAAALNETICPNEIAEVTANGAQSYTWNISGGIGATATLQPASTTTVEVTGTAVNGCVGAVSVVITVDACTAMRTGNYEEIKIFPLPVSENLNVEQYTGLLTLFDATGKILLQRDVAGNTEMNLSHLPDGIYLLQLSNSIARETRRIVKE